MSFLMIIPPYYYCNSFVSVCVMLFLLFAVDFVSVFFFRLFVFFVNVDVVLLNSFKPLAPLFAPNSVETVVHSLSDEYLYSIYTPENVRILLSFTSSKITGSIVLQYKYLSMILVRVPVRSL